MKIRACAEAASPAALEAAGVVSGIDAIRIYVDLDGPEPPTDSLSVLIDSSRAHETETDPRLARALGRTMRQQAFEIRRRASVRELKTCRRGLHQLTPGNVVDGKCRDCWNAARRDRRSRAA